MVKEKIGQLLLKSNKINLIQLQMALDVQRFSKEPLGRILKKLAACSEADIIEALVQQKD